MSAAEFRASLADLEISQSAFGRLTGYDPRTVRRWIAGEVEVPQVVRLLLRAIKLLPSRSSEALLRE